MGAQDDGGGVVGQDGNGHAPGHDRFVDRTDEPAVEVLDGLEFEGEVAVVARLVAGLHVDEDEIVLGDGFDGGLRLAFVVGVVKPGRTFHLNRAQSGVAADSPDEVHRRDDGAGVNLREGLRQRRHGRPIAAGPGPDAIGRVFPFGDALAVDRMVREKFLRTQDQFIQQVRRRLSFGALRLDQQGLPGLEGMVVGRGAFDALVASLDDQQVPVLDAGIEMNPLAAEFLLKETDEDIALFRAQVAGRVVFDFSVFEANQVAADGHIPVFEGNADAGGLERSSSFEDLVLVVAEDGGVGHFAAGMHVIGNRLEQAAASHAGEGIHIRSVCRLQEGLSAQPLVGPVGHAVSYGDNVLHNYMFAMLMMSAKTPAAVTLAPAP